MKARYSIKATTDGFMRPIQDVIDNPDIVIDQEFTPEELGTEIDRLQKLKPRIEIYNHDTEDSTLIIGCEVRITNPKYPNSIIQS